MTTDSSTSVQDRLFNAAEQGDVQAVIAILKDAPELGLIRDSRPDRVERLERHRHTALMVAAEHGHLACVQALLPCSDAAAFTHHEKKYTALTYAAREGHDDCCALLLPHSPVDPLIENIDETALSTAMQANHEDCARTILDYYRIGEGVGKGWYTFDAWMSAAIQGTDTYVRMLLPYFDANAHDVEFHQTALMWSLCRPQVACTEFLIQHSDVDARDQEGSNALMIAVSRGRAEAVKALIPHSDMNARDKHGQTALMLACSRNHTAIVQALLPFSDTNARGRNGETVLMVAAKDGKTNESVWLILPFSDAKATSNNGRTALMYACSNDRITTIECLLPFSDVKAQDEHGETALMIAAQSGSTATAVKTLLPFSYAKACNHDGQTALMKAASAGQVANVKLLIPHSDVKAENNHPNVESRTAFRLARGYKKWDCVDLLAAFEDMETLGDVLNEAPFGALPTTSAIFRRWEALLMKATALDVMVDPEEKPRRTRL